MASPKRPDPIRTSHATTAETSRVSPVATPKKKPIKFTGTARSPDKGAMNSTSAPGPKTVPEQLSVSKSQVNFEDSMQRIQKFGTMLKAAVSKPG